MHMVRKKYIVVVIIFSVVIASIILLSLFWNINLNNEKSDEPEYNVITKIIDGNDIYEVRLAYFETKSKVYKNNVHWLNIGEQENIGEYMEFKLDGKDGKQIKLEEYKTLVNGVYKIDMYQSKLYINNLIDKGYKLKREVMTENSTDVYLEDKNKKIIRLIVLSDRLIKMNYAKESLPDIESYWNN